MNLNCPTCGLIIQTWLPILICLPVVPYTHTSQLNCFNFERVQLKIHKESTVTKKNVAQTTW